MNRILCAVSAACVALMLACQPVTSSGKNKRYTSGERPAGAEDGEKTDQSRSKKKPVQEAGEDDEKEGIVLDNDPVEDDEEKSSCHKADEEVCALEKQVFELTNQLRKDQGRPPLKLSRELSWSARQWSDQMGSLGIISHAGFPGKRQRDYQEEFGRSASMNAENVAMNFTDASRVAAGFFDMWKNSSGHRSNMLGNSGSIGVGIAKNARGAWYATQIFGR